MNLFEVPIIKWIKNETMWKIFAELIHSLFKELKITFIFIFAHTFLVLEVLIKIISRFKKLEIFLAETISRSRKVSNTLQVRKKI